MLTIGGCNKNESSIIIAIIIIIIVILIICIICYSINNTNNIKCDNFSNNIYCTGNNPYSYSLAITKLYCNNILFYNYNNNCNNNEQFNYGEPEYKNFCFSIDNCIIKTKTINNYLPCMTCSSRVQYLSCLGNTFTPFG